MRTLSANTTTKLADGILRPVWLVDINLATPLYYSSRGAITYNGKSYVAAGMDVNLGSRQITIFNDAFGLSSTFFAATSGTPVDVYLLFGESGWATGDAEYLYTGEIGAFEIGPAIVLSLRDVAPRRVPRLYPEPPGFNHIPPNGTEFKTTTGIYVVGSDKG